ncbi:alpha/beta fold hydrolase [Pseudonocardia humida]|uniref:alpha/beta fold hydrolase n=1 Tax=Pseudonocardia humida TaxID=2800819 RepID=UPI00207D0223|nr:alpha/beta fold hydrolase [Pseudonocardia humida]
MSARPAAGPLPRIEPVGAVPAAPPAAVLVLHGGRSRSHESGERRRLSYWRMLPFARSLARRGPAVHVLRYRYRGWNGPARDAARDAAAGVDAVAARHPGVPVVLLGHSMGGRAALAAAGADPVVAVCALAPWLDGSDPVEQLAGRTVLIAHGDRERWTSPAASFDYAVRAKRVTDRVARFDVHGAGHFMLARAGEWHGLVRRFVLGVTGVEPLDPVIADALRRPSPPACGPRRPTPRAAAADPTG